MRSGFGHFRLQTAAKRKSGTSCTPSSITRSAGSGTTGTLSRWCVRAPKDNVFRSCSTSSRSKSLLEQLKDPGKTAVLLDILTGLRVSELLALKWSDVDFENLEIHVTKSIADQHVGPCKTEASQKPVPLDPELGEALLTWRRKSPYPMQEDWVFASTVSSGKLPYWSFSIFRTDVKPALKKAKITSKVGWHTFRHSFATILKAHGEDVKTVQELMRHANSSVTLNLYAQAVTDIKRTAQSKVARLVFSEKGPNQD